MTTPCYWVIVKNYSWVKEAIFWIYNVMVNLVLFLALEQISLKSYSPEIMIKHPLPRHTLVLKYKLSDIFLHIGRVMLKSNAIQGILSRISLNLVFFMLRKPRRINLFLIRCDPIAKTAGPISTELTMWPPTDHMVLTEELQEWETFPGHPQMFI